VAILAQAPPRPGSTPDPAAPISRREGRDRDSDRLRRWRDALSKGIAQDVIVTFRPDPAVASKATGADAVAIEKRALAFAAVKRSVFAAAGDEVEVLRDYGHLPVAFVRLRTPVSLDRLRARGEVEGLFENRVQHPLADVNLRLIGQPAVAAAGLQGAGVTVAVLDGPVEYGNPAFGCVTPGNPSTCGVAYAKAFAAGGNSIAADHATSVAGIVLEVAPASKVISLDIYSGVDSTDEIWMQAVDWCIANRAAYDIVALNLSFGSGRYEEPCDPSAYETVLRSVRDAGMIPVAGAGNGGYLDALPAPACAPSAVSVGAVFDASYGAFTWPVAPICTDYPTYADQVPCFSDSAPFLSILAPGVRVASAGLVYTGTSQAVPHVAGAVAVLRAGFSGDSLGVTLEKLLVSGKPVTNARSGVTTPRLQLDTAAFGPYPPCRTSAVALPFHVSGELRNDTCASVSPAGLVSYDNLYTFEGSAGQQVSAALTSSTFDTSLSLLAPDGSVAATAAAVPGTARDSGLTFTLTASGTWTIRASSYWPASTGSYEIAAATGAVAPLCARTATSLCLEDRRFVATATWEKPGGATGAGAAIPLTGDTGAFWFFDPSNVEAIVKVLDACGVNGSHWVFASGLTNVKVTLVVTDTVTQVTKLYENPANTAFTPIQDTSAFPACP
jgi:subtilisin family serine protease